MSKLGMRQRLLVGGLALAAAIWAIDSVTGDGEPKPARAAGTPTASAVPTVKWHDIAPTVEGLTHVTYDSVTPRLRRLQRDLFVPSAAMLAVHSPPQPVAPQVVELDEAEPEDTFSFADAHTLTGVLTGQRPIAVIDSMPLAVGAELDGHVLVEVRRSQVVLERISDGTRVQLVLTPPGHRDGP
jgi:hypothetical protein